MDWSFQKVYRYKYYTLRLFDQHFKTFERYVSQMNTTDLT